MAITNDEKQSIINAVLSSIRTNSRTIDQLTIVTEVADTDNFEIHGGKRVAFSKLRELILSKSGVGAINDKLPELDDVVEFKEVRNDITLIATQQTSVLGGIAGSTDAGYGAVYDPTRKRFFLMYYGEEAQTDASVVTAYGNFADEDRFGASPSSGGGRVPVSGKLYLCKNDGSLYHWNGADLVVVAAKKHAITLQQAVAGTGAWSGPAFDDIRVGDTLTFTDTETQTATVFCEYKTSANARALCAAYAHANETNSVIMLLWLTDSGTYGKGGLPTSQTVVDWLDKKQKTLAATTDVKVQSADEDTDGLYLTDSAKRAVFNDMFNLAAGSDGGYKPSEAPDPAKPYLLNTLWLSYEEAEREMLDYTSIITFWKRAIRRSGPNVFCIGSFDETTRTGTLNGISGLSLSEMTDILLAGNPTAAGATYHFAFNPFIRTNLWQMWYMDSTVVGQRCFYKCANIEVACASYLRVDTDTFSHCPKLHTIIGPLYGYGNNPAPFRGCSALVNLPGFGWNGNLDISDSPLLSLASVSALIDKGKEGATITVHADVFAKLTGDTTNPAVAALTPAELAQWQQILSAATAKNISFTTP